MAGQGYRHFYIARNGSDLSGLLTWRGTKKTACRNHLSDRPLKSESRFSLKPEAHGGQEIPGGLGVKIIFRHHLLPRNVTEGVAIGFVQAVEQVVYQQPQLQLFHPGHRLHRVPEPQVRHLVAL
jgi:hypothetical protein